MSHLTFSIIIPSWRGIKLLKKNLPSVLKLPVKEIILVDDASPEDDASFVNQHFPDVITIRKPTNHGFGTTVNTGAKQATGDILLLLNLDAKPSPDILPFLEQDFKDPQVFAVSLAEEQYGPTKLVFKNGYLAHDSVVPRPDHISPTFWVSGGSGAFRRSIWEELGGLDSIYDPFYWEDIDLCHRASLQGYKNLWDPRAKVEHVHEGTIGKHIPSKRKQHIQERNHLIFTWKNLTPTQWPIHLYHLLIRFLHHPGYLRILTAAFTRLIRP